MVGSTPTAPPLSTYLQAKINSLTTENQGRTQGACSRCPGTSLGQKMSGGEYRAKKLSARVKFFSAGEHPPQQISGYAPAENGNLKKENDELEIKNNRLEADYNRLEADYNKLNEKMNDIQFYYKILIKKFAHSRIRKK